MNELSLFTGAGGGLLGTKLLGWKHIGYVEIEPYCQKVLAQRIKDGILDNAPIFTDIRAFIDSGCVELYRGVADVITAGFPCQPFSVAGKQRGEEDERNMWPETIRCIRMVRPQYCLLENVPGLLAHRYIQRIFGDLAEAGYDARWCVLGADDCGANHRRKRLWILAYSNENSKPIMPVHDQWTISRSVDVTLTSSDGLYPPELSEFQWNNGKTQTRTKVCSEISGHRALGEKGDTEQKTLAYTTNKGLSQTEPSRQSFSIYDAERIGCERTGRWWAVEPELGRVAHGVAHRVDRLKAIGNGQVPIVVKTVWGLLAGKGEK